MSDITELTLKENISLQRRIFDTMSIVLTQGFGFMKLCDFASKKRVHLWVWIFSLNASFRVTFGTYEDTVRYGIK